MKIPTAINHGTGPSLGRVFRIGHVERLLTLAARYEDVAYEAAAQGHPKRNRYEEYWAERTRALAGLMA